MAKTFLCGGARSLAVKSVLGDVAPAVQGVGTQGVTKAALTHGFHQTNVVPDLAL